MLVIVERAHEVKGLGSTNVIPQLCEQGPCSQHLAQLVHMVGTHYMSTTKERREYGKVQARQSGRAPKPGFRS